MLKLYEFLVVKLSGYVPGGAPHIVTLIEWQPFLYEKFRQPIPIFENSNMQ